MKTKLLSLITFLLPLSFNISAQSDHYSTPDVINYGVYLVKGNDKQNAIMCRVAKDREITTFHPGEVTEYGFGNGTEYKFKTIVRGESYQKYFLEQLCKGTLNLYYLNDGTTKSFFVEDHSGELTEISKNNTTGNKGSFRTDVSSITGDCAQVVPYSELLTFSKKSMKEYFTLYNDCSSSKFRFTRFGLIAGVEITDYKHTQSQLSYLNFRYFNFRAVAAPYFGAFIDRPLYVDNFSLHFETILSTIEVNDKETVKGTDYSISLKTTSLTLPLSIRYSLPTKNFAPYFNAGLLYSLSLSNSNSLIEKSSEIRDLSNYYSFVPGSMIGITASGGFQIYTSVRNSLFFEFRFTQKYGTHLNEYIRSTGTGLSVGYNF